MLGPDVPAKMEFDVISVRPASLDDCHRIWEWANDPETRARSFVSDPIPWDTHVAWFNQKLALNTCDFFVAEHNGDPCGLVRFDLNDSHPGEFCISVAIAAAARGKKLASPVIVAGLQAHFAKRTPHTVHAYIKPDNLASIKAFERAGFRSSQTSTIRGHAALHYTFSPEKPAIDSLVPTSKNEFP